MVLSDFWSAPAGRLQTCFDGGFGVDQFTATLNPILAEAGPAVTAGSIER